MSAIYLSFASIAGFFNNNPITVSPFGELSNKARTYTKDPAVFSIHPETSETILFNFQTKTKDKVTTMPMEAARKQIEVSNWLVAEATKGNLTSDRKNTLDQLRKAWSKDITFDEVGMMVTDNKYWMPSFIRGTQTVKGVVDTFYLWFADQYFREQYPKVSFTIIHPVPLEEIDLLIELNYVQLTERLQLETPDVIEDRTHALTDGAAWPYTERKVQGFEVLDLLNKPKSVMAYWRWVEWGNGRDAEDELYDQIQKEILDNSKYPREDWEEKIPDLFNPLEYYAIPYFDRKGLVNKTNDTASHSPIVDAETSRGHVDFYLTPHLTSAHVIKSLQYVPFLYKSTLCAIVGKKNNRKGFEKVQSIYPDYQLISSLDSEFGLMDRETMRFIQDMENLISAAEVTTDITLVPQGMSRVERFDKLWLTRRIGRVKMLTLLKWQMKEDKRVE